jgi:hypothetical protein
MLGGPSDRPALVYNTTREQQATARSQYGISMDHEGLLFVADVVVAAPLHDREAFTHQRPLQRVVTLSQPRTLGSTSSRGPLRCT